MSDPLIPPTSPPDRALDPERTDDQPAFPAAAGSADAITREDSALAVPVSSLPLPALVGPYRVAREIARGGMGVVLAAEDPKLGRDLAIKVLLDAHRDKSSYRERFLEEARVTGLLQHPGIIPVYEEGELADGCPYFVMPLVDGETLAARLERRANPAEELPGLLAVFARVCETLAFAHSRCVIHRDLKPLNVMLAPFGVVKVMDWGVAKVYIPGLEEAIYEGSGELPTLLLGATEFGGAVGTPAYMAPEQAQGDRSRTDERTDVFGLGGILCAILTGQPPYLGTSAHRVRARAARGDLTEAFTRLDASPAARDLVALAKWCLTPIPDARPKNAQAVLAALNAYIESDLRRAERDLVRFFDLTLDLLCIAGLDGYFRRVNPNFTRVLGYSTAELLATPFIEFAHPDDREAIAAEVEKLSRGLPTIRFHSRIRDAHGNYRWCEWTSQSIPEEGVIFAVGRDITERKQAEVALRRSEARTRQLLDRASDACICMDAEGRITEWNRKAERLLGWSRGEVHGRSLAETIIPEAHRDVHVRGLARFVATGEAHVLDRPLELAVLARDDRVVPAEVTITAFPWEGSYIFSAAIRDISDRKAQDGPSDPEHDGGPD